MKTFTIVCLGLLFLITGCEFSGFPAVGTKAVVSENKILGTGVTGRDVCTLEPFVDASLHQMTIRSALESHMPLVVMFGTPQHCTQCVEQIGLLTAFAKQYAGRVAFAHVDAYRDTATIKAWSVKGEPWTGLIDRDGVIRFVFHGPMTFPELAPKIRELLAMPEKKGDAPPS